MSGGVTTSYVYDGDGNRVKETSGDVTRIFVGNYYGVDNGVVKKYYYAGSTRVAENRGSTLYYLLGDHLGSTSVVIDENGGVVAQLRYKPFGEPRGTASTALTDRQFTGQRAETGLGSLYDYKTRHHSPSHNRQLSTGEAFWCALAQSVCAMRA